MATTLTVSSTTVTLPDDLLWADEWTWTAVEQTTERTLTGALVVSAAAKTGGRPITLQSPDEEGAWFTGAVLAQLQAWTATPLLQMTLLHRGITRAVMWRHQDGAMEADPVVFISDADSTDHYTATLRLMEV